VGIGQGPNGSRTSSHVRSPRSLEPPAVAVTARMRSPEQGHLPACRHNDMTTYSRRATVTTRLTLCNRSVSRICVPARTRQQRDAMTITNMLSSIGLQRRICRLGSASPSAAATTHEAIRSPPRRLRDPIRIHVDSTNGYFLPSSPADAVKLSLLNASYKLGSTLFLSILSQTLLTKVTSIGAQITDAIAHMSQQKHC
jgi:hypothetical protein